MNTIKLNLKDWSFRNEGKCTLRGDINGEPYGVTIDSERAVSISKYDLPIREYFEYMTEINIVETESGTELRDCDIIEFSDGKLMITLEEKLSTKCNILGYTVEMLKDSKDVKIYTECPNSNDILEHWIIAPLSCTGDIEYYPCSIETLPDNITKAKGEVLINTEDHNFAFLDNEDSEYLYINNRLFLGIEWNGDSIGKLVCNLIFNENLIKDNGMSNFNFN